MTRLRRPLALLAAAALAAGLAACGNKDKPEKPGRVIEAETEGIYLDIGKLKYQVQISRQLNPNDVEDRVYLQGIPESEQELKPDELWFGVFLRVQNTGKESARPASAIEIEDTQDEVFEPIVLDATNTFAYTSEDQVPPKGVLPELGSIPSESPIQGSLVLFKVTNEALDNRPLELKIEGRDLPQQTGIVQLDV